MLFCHSNFCLPGNYTSCVCQGGVVSVLSCLFLFTRRSLPFMGLCQGPSLSTRSRTLSSVRDWGHWNAFVLLTSDWALGHQNAFVLLCLLSCCLRLSPFTGLAIFSCAFKLASAGTEGLVVSDGNFEVVHLLPAACPLPAGSS